MDYSKLDFYKNHKGAKQRSCGGSGRSRRNKNKQLSVWKEQEASLKRKELAAKNVSKEELPPPPPPVDSENANNVANFVNNFQVDENDIENMFMPLPSTNKDNKPVERTTEILPPPPPFSVDGFDDSSEQKRDTALSGSKQNEEEKSEKLAKSKSDFSLSGDNLNRGSKFMFEASAVRNENIKLKKKEEEEEDKIYKTLSI